MKFIQLLEINKNHNLLKEFDPLKWLQGVEDDRKEFNTPKNQKMRMFMIKSKTVKLRNEIKKIDDDIINMQMDIKKRESKYYKKTSGSIDTNDEFGQYAGSINISRLNELKRKKIIRQIKYNIALAEEKIIKLSNQVMDIIRDIEDYDYTKNPYLKDIVKQYYIDDIELRKRMEHIHRNKIPFEKWIRTKG